MTLILSAVCAACINAGAAEVQADTLDRYVINGVKVEKFNGTQLIGKTVSDYRIIVADGKKGTPAIASKDKVFRIHLICTDGNKVKDAGQANNDAGKNGATVYIIDGKKCSKEALNNIRPESIASMTVYKLGCKEAENLSGRKDVSVVKVETKK